MFLKFKSCYQLVQLSVHLFKKDTDQYSPPFFQGESKSGVALLPALLTWVGGDLTNRKLPTV